MEQKTSSLVILDKTYNQLLVVVVDVSDQDYLARDIMLIQPTQYKAIDIHYIDHQQYMAVGSPIGTSDGKTTVVLYSVN